ncbi:MAG: sulfurtransferase [Acidobacteria bacterium]|nr:sulfurtransferase [Acidobacteriota bacterium]
MGCNARADAIEFPGPVVSCGWLRERLGHPGLVLLEARLQAVAPGQPQGGPLGIPGARVFDLEWIRDRSSKLPHTMPSPREFEVELQGLGVCSESRVVVYDPGGVYASPRVRWMIRAMGHDRVAVLDGGLDAWKAGGHPVEANPGGGWDQGDFTAHPRAGWFTDAQGVMDALEGGHACVVDARSEGRFRGLDPEPRPGLRGGHMPGAVNLPYEEVLRGGHLRPLAELRDLLGRRVGDRSRLVFTCGSGVTACLPALAAELAGYAELSVYDGSWSEWGSREDWPLARG